MRAGQGRTAQPPVGDQLLRRHGIDLGRALPVAQLADVVVARAAVEVLGRAQPAEEDVARGLHEALTLDDALTGVPVVARAEERLVHRWLGFLDLQEERIAVVSPEQERDPGLRAHAADADDLAREVGQLVAVEKDAPVVLQRAAVFPHHASERRDGLGSLLLVEVVERDDQRRLRDDARVSVDDAGELREGVHAVARARLGDELPRPLARSGIHLAGYRRAEGLDVDPRVPDVDVASRREPRHQRAVRPGGLEHAAFAVALRQSAFAPRDRDARHQSLEIPLPRARERLVEIVDVEDQAPLGRAEDAEVRKVGIAAALNVEAGTRRRPRGRRP